jgi:hypothetical protein
MCLSLLCLECMRRAPPTMHVVSTHAAYAGRSMRLSSQPMGSRPAGGTAAAAATGIPPADRFAIASATYYISAVDAGASTTAICAAGATCNEHSCATDLLVLVKPPTSAVMP